MVSISFGVCGIGFAIVEVIVGMLIVPVALIVANGRDILFDPLTSTSGFPLSFAGGRSAGDLMFATARMGIKYRMTIRAVFFFVSYEFLYLKNEAIMKRVQAYLAED